MGFQVGELERPVGIPKGSDKTLGIPRDSTKGLDRGPVVIPRIPKRNPVPPAPRMSSLNTYHEDVCCAGMAGFKLVMWVPSLA